MRPKPLMPTFTVTVVLLMWNVIYKWGLPDWEDARGTEPSRILKRQKSD
jgi:hypothetical protein